MRISIAADHGGFALKQQIVPFLKELGHTVLDRGTNSESSVDYPDYAIFVVRDIVSGEAERGIVMCGTGLGISMAANRHKGVRAALVQSGEYAKLSREHNDANVLAMGGRFTSLDSAKEFITIFLETPFEGDRHVRRIKKIDTTEI
ncbi:ribose 5-phosphate isomerase B [bacterium]|nr:ribose 5-phosphate isomerase B [bacterium]